MTTYIGHMWFDNNPHANIEQKIRNALAHYATAGMVFNACRVNPTTLNGNGLKVVDGIELETSTSVMPNHFWFGRKLEEAHE